MQVVPPHALNKETSDVDSGKHVDAETQKTPNTAKKPTPFKTTKKKREKGILISEPKVQRFGIQPSEINQDKGKHIISEVEKDRDKKKKTKENIESWLEEERRQDDRIGQDQATLHENPKYHTTDEALAAQLAMEEAEDQDMNPLLFKRKFMKRCCQR